MRQSARYARGECRDLPREVPVLREDVPQALLGADHRIIRQMRILLATSTAKHDVKILKKTMQSAHLHHISIKRRQLT